MGLYSGVCLTHHCCCYCSCTFSYMGEWYRIFGFLFL